VGALAEGDHLRAQGPDGTQTPPATHPENLQELIAGIEEWDGCAITVEVLTGGLANLNYVVRVDGEPFVVKLITQSMDDFGLMIPIRHLLANTVAAGRVGVGARAIRTLPEIPAVVLEHIDGKTLSTEDLAEGDYIPRIAQAIRRLHTEVSPFGNRVDIWDFLDRYLSLVREHDLKTPDGLMDALPAVSAIRHVLDATGMALVASHNDLLARNLMDDGKIRLIDYDFSGAGDPCFDLGDVAMEGDYSPDDLEQLCSMYFGEHLPDMVTRARLFGIGAQYTWSLLFAGMAQLLPEMPDDDFDYFQEAVSRWEWTRDKLDAPDLGAAIEGLGR
jgi:thiamine kinase-like enzyme